MSSFAPFSAAASIMSDADFLKHDEELPAYTPAAVPPPSYAPTLLRASSFPGPPCPSSSSVTATISPSPPESSPPSSTWSPTASPSSSIPVNPYSGRTTLIPPSISSFTLTLDDPSVTFRGVESLSTDDFQRNPTRLSGSVRLSVAPDSTPASTAARLQTLQSISLRIRGSERTVPSGLTTSFGFASVLDSRVVLWERNESGTVEEDDMIHRRIVFGLSIPPHCPPTYVGPCGEVAYYVDAVLKRIGGLPDVVVRHAFTVSRAPTKLELNRWGSERQPSTTTTPDATWEGTGVVDMAALSASPQKLVKADGSVVLSAKLVQTSDYRGVQAPLFRKPRPTSWSRDVVVGDLEVEDHGSALRFPDRKRLPALMQDADGGLVAVTHRVVLRLRDLDGAERSVDLKVRIVPAF